MCILTGFHYLCGCHGNRNLYHTEGECFKRCLLCTYVLHNVHVITGVLKPSAISVITTYTAHLKASPSADALSNVHVNCSCCSWVVSTLGHTLLHNQTHLGHRPQRANVSPSSSLSVSFFKWLAVLPCKECVFKCVAGDEAVLDSVSLLVSVSLCLIATVTIVTLRYMGVAS